MKYFFFSLVLCAALGACVADAPSPEDLRARLDGRWELATATRSGKATESLDGTFFEFAPTELTTNISGAASTAAYTLDGMTIESSDPRLTQDYEITYLSADTLRLQLEMRNYQFDFFLLKAPQGE